jgi:hypothetical protein
LPAATGDSCKRNKAKIEPCSEQNRETNKKKQKPEEKYLGEEDLDGWRRGRRRRAGGGVEAEAEGSVGEGEEGGGGGGFLSLGVLHGGAAAGYATGWPGGELVKVSVFLGGH